ncbi:hypothetical protein [Gordonia insulae]|uniref:hypothetical protein n=1 Tax=Gordonia insulae TaxID=2420509 RepID=UPI000F5BD613|nr:hypothetical protein [Gordonia insulae]
MTTSRDPESVSCIELGPTKWTQLEPYLAEIKKLEEEGVDDAALAFFEALLEDSEEGAIAPGDYKAPLGTTTMSVAPAWIGEFGRQGAHRKGEGGRREYRLYFGEAPHDGRSAVAALFAWKTAREMKEQARHQTQSHRRTRSKAHVKQTTQIGKAQSIVKRWATQESCTYRILRR